MFWSMTFRDVEQLFLFFPELVSSEPSYWTQLKKKKKKKTFRHKLTIVAGHSSLQLRYRIFSFLI